MRTGHHIAWRRTGLSERDRHHARHRLTGVRRSGERSQVGVAQSGYADRVAQRGPAGLDPLLRHLVADPVHLEQRVARSGVGGSRELVRRDRAKGERLDRGNRRARAVGEHQGDTRTDGCDPYPQEGRPHGGHRHPAPCERQACFSGRALALAGRKTHRVQRGVQQGGVDAEPRGIRSLRQCDLGEQLVATPPGSPQPLERRTVAEPHLRQVLVQTLYKRQVHFASASSAGRP